MSLIIREIQIKTTMTCHLTLIRMAIINKSTSVGEDVKKGELFCTADGNANWCSHCEKQYRVSTKRLKMELPYDPVIPLLEIYLRKPETLI